MKKMIMFLKGKIRVQPWMNSAVLASILLCVSSWSYAWEYPIIKGYGPINPLPNADFQADRSTRYRVLFEITRAAETMDKVNPGLDRVARFLNVMAASNIMPNDIE